MPPYLSYTRNAANMPSGGRRIIRGDAGAMRNELKLTFA
jgi:hypothetical protein